MDLPRLAQACGGDRRWGDEPEDILEAPAELRLDESVRSCVRKCRERILELFEFFKVSCWEQIWSR